MLTVSFRGAAQEVTGSCHVLEADGRRIALDCGLFQGDRKHDHEKNRTFDIDPKSLHAVVLSHAHIDHCGRLPMLVARGFDGPIYSTPATRDLCALLLADSAHIQQEDTQYLNKKLQRKGKPTVSPLYEEHDAHAALHAFHSVSQERWFWVTRRVRVRFHHAGHMLGSSSVEVVYNPPDSDKPIRLCFTGDIGRPDMPILRDPKMLEAFDYVITESTYGNRTHPPTGDLKGELARIVGETSERGGKVIIPAFSVGRTQVIVYYLHQLMREGKVQPIPIYVDSPLAVNATEVFRLHPDLYDREAKSFQRMTGDILGCSSCTYVQSVDESKAIHKSKKPAVIISASGMCEAGRIRHHLKNNIQDAKNTILIVGFMAAHTLGRRIKEEQPKVNIFGKEYKLKAQVATLNGFSAHADREELRGLLKPHAEGCKGAFLVHGELDQMQGMRDMLRGDGYRDIYMPDRGETFELGHKGARQIESGGD